MQISTKTAATVKPTRHSFRPGIGYVLHDTENPKPMGKDAQNLCSPPAVAADGSPHLLTPPGGGKPMAFLWVSKSAAWARMGGKRMAFTAVYLSSHGWRYLGAA